MNAPERSAMFEIHAGEQSVWLNAVAPLNILSILETPAEGIFHADRS